MRRVNWPTRLLTIWVLLGFAAACSADSDAPSPSPGGGASASNAAAPVHATTNFLNLSPITRPFAWPRG